MIKLFALTFSSLIFFLGSIQAEEVVEKKSMPAKVGVEQDEIKQAALKKLKEDIVALASENYGTRVAAQKQIEALGKTFEEKIENALKVSKDLEVQCRLKSVLRSWRPKPKPVKVEVITIYSYEPWIIPE